ncbi:helix-turn-helix domain-containing protein [Nocardia flavorosea]|uniref:helix-turn-helix domain-containing protein n=1 Tax=Nocardia flavorosea TaxID=53429 RepID=UPI001894B95E|nr:helix-turn-helix domain-containing protein [Nocardia flavorosea]MBF6351202.1 helix-turn-helix domain-containing protein [Nocardia flavorosea]
MNSTDDNYLVDNTDTRDIARAERIDYWLDLLTVYQCRLGADDYRRDDFAGRAVRQRSATYQLVGWQSRPIVYRRTRAHIRADPDDDYRLLFPVYGPIRLDVGETRISAEPGDAALFTMAKPIGIHQPPDSAGFALTIPRREIDIRIGDTAVALNHIDFRTGLGRVVSDMAGGLFTQRHEFTAGEFDAVCDRLVELVCMLLVGDNAPTARPHLADVEASIRRYVRAHALDPGLDGHVVAQALGWSVRQIQLALQQAGTSPRRLIKEERLTRAMAYLRSPGPRPPTITDIAYRCGFSSVSAFSSAFRERYGRSPSAVRAERPTEQNP